MADVDPDSPKASLKERREQKRQERDEAKEIAIIEKSHRLVELYTINAGEVLDSATDTTPFVIDKAVPAGFITFLAGDKDSNKSWLAYDMALSVMHHRPWLGFEVVQKGSVLLLNYDNPTGELRRRLKRMGLERDDPLRVHSLGASNEKIPEGLPVMLYLPKALEAVQAIVDYLAPTLIILDSFRRSHMLNELSPEDMSMLMAAMRSLTTRGSALVILHHTPKNRNEQGEKQLTLRGTGEIDASADVQIFVESERSTDGRPRNGIIQFGKTRGWLPEVMEQDFEVFDKGKRTIVQMMDIFAPLLELLSQNGPMRRRDIATELELSRSAAAVLLHKAEQAELIDTEVRDGNTRLVGLR